MVICLPYNAVPDWNLLHSFFLHLSSISINLWVPVLKTYNRRQIGEVSMHISLVKDVSRRSIKWKILVFVAHTREYSDQDAGQYLYELDFIVTSRQGSTMKGYVPANNIDKFRE